MKKSLQLKDEFTQIVCSKQIPSSFENKLGEKHLAPEDN